MNINEQFEAQQKELEALKAQVNHLREIALSWTHDQYDGTDLLDEALAEINESPEQCLNSFKADAIDEAVDILDCNINYNDGCHSCITQDQLISYANKLRTGKS